MSVSLRPFACLSAFALVVPLSACGGGEDETEAVETADPALTGALADQIMVDPDLAGQNKGGAAMGANGPASAALPPPDKSAEAIAAARAEATKLAGGKIDPAPAPVSSAEAGAEAVTPAQLAAQAQGAAANCADKVEYSAAWATRLPAALSVYPRGNVVEAAGTDKDGCRLRVVNFVTPVPQKDVLDFYYTRARAAGFDAEHRTEGNDSVLGGSKGAAAYIIYVRKAASGMTEVDVIASGG